MNNYSPAELAQQLARNSTPYFDPLAKIAWDRLNTDDYWLPPTALSLYGLPAFASLPELQRRRLSQYEFLNFIEAGLWLEGLFMQRLAGSLRRPQARAVTRYRLHELREEAGHSLMFLEVMERSGLALAYRPYRHLWLAQTFVRIAPLESVTFALATALGEEISDRLNRYVRKRQAEVNPAIAQICTAHIIDEARHIAFAHDSIERQLATLPAWRHAALARFVGVLLRQFVAAFYFPRADLYEQVGLYPGASWARAARANPARRAFIDECLNPTLQHFRRHGLQLRAL